MWIPNLKQDTASYLHRNPACPCSQAYLDTFEDLLLTAQGLGMPAPILPQATTMGRLTSLEMATSQELGM